MVTERSPRNRHRNVTKEGKDQEVRGPSRKHHVSLTEVPERKNRQNGGQEIVKE